MNTDHKGLPVAGYVSQSTENVALVNVNKHLEEVCLSRIDQLLSLPVPIGGKPPVDPRWAAIARTHIEQGFMALNRAVFQPERIKPPEDE